MRAPLHCEPQAKENTQSHNTTTTTQEVNSSLSLEDPPQPLLATNTQDYLFWIPNPNRSLASGFTLPTHIIFPETNRGAPWTNS